MLKIYINLGGKWDDYPECPLRSDLNTCGACQDSKINKINSCPQLDDEGEKYTVPDWCPHEPCQEDINHPELWKSASWRWFIINC